MPLYEFENKETGEVEEHLMKIADYDQFLLDNPQLKRVYLTPLNIDSDGGKTVLQRAGDGWKAVQDKIKKGLPPRLRDNIKTK